MNTNSINSTDSNSVASDPVAKVESFLNLFLSTSGLDLQFKHVPPPETAASSDQVEEPSAPIISLGFTGADTAVLTARNGEALHALEYMAARILRFEPTQHDQITFDAANFKQNRANELQASANAAIQSVRNTGRPYAFPPMSSRERRILHLTLAESGLPTSSKGENPRRYVVVYPHGYQTPQAVQQPYRMPGETSSSAADRTQAIRERFRRR